MNPSSPDPLRGHDPADLFAAAALLGDFPEIHLFTISVETIIPMCLQLSPEVEAAVPEVVLAVAALAQRLALDGEPTG